MTDLATATLPQQQTSLSPTLRRIAVLLALSAFLNYIDRGNLGLASDLIRADLSISLSQLGTLLSAFFATYALFQIVSGWLVDRFDVSWVLALGLLLWSVATFVTGLVHGFILLLIMRLVLGIGESVAYPSYSKIIAAHFSETQRGRANSFISAGQYLGPAFGTFLGGLLITRIGWRQFFFALGIATSLWCLPWIRYKPNPAGSMALPESPEPPVPAILEILRHRSAWGSFAGLFAYNYLSYFLLSWLPFYLKTERHFSLQTMSTVTGGAFLALAVSAAISGWLSDRWIASGGEVTRVRKTFTGGGPLLASSILLVAIIANHAAAMMVLFLVCIGMGMCSSNLWAVTQTLAGVQTAGKWTGLQNFMGNFAGVLGPWLTGVVVQRTGNFFWAFAITAAVTLVGSFAWILVIGPIRQVPWLRRTSGSA
jgi:MFS transporter, ACS family, D-galactonate transporter